jgi:hypothetical protein
VKGGDLGGRAGVAGKCQIEANLRTKQITGTSGLEDGSRENRRGERSQSRAGQDEKPGKAAMREAATAMSTARERSRGSDWHAMGQADNKKRLDEPKIRVATHCLT